MKKGDIVYFKSIYTALYCNKGGPGTYPYHFKPGDRYRLDSDIISPDTHQRLSSASITNLEDGTRHFAHSDIFNKLISQEEWREMQLDKLIG